MKLQPDTSIDKITIIQQIDKNLFKCICSCGKTCLKTRATLHTANHRKTGLFSCGCSVYQYKTGNNSYKWKGYGEISSRKWHTIRGNAKRRNLEFSITKKEAWQQFLNQNQICVYTGETLTHNQSTYDSSGTASLDRIDNTKGYIKSNIQWIHKTVNKMKMDLSNNRFIDYCFYINNPLINTKSDDLLIKPKHGNWNGYGNISGDLWWRIITNAKKRNIKFSITIEEAWNVFIYQKGVCALTGIPLWFTCSGITASLDRIDNNLDYCSNNIQWIHKDVNTKLKQTLSIQELRYWTEKIERYLSENSKNS